MIIALFTIYAHTTIKEITSESREVEENARTTQQTLNLQCTVVWSYSRDWDDWEQKILQKKTTEAVSVC